MNDIQSVTSRGRSSRTFKYGAWEDIQEEYKHKKE